MPEESEDRGKGTCPADFEAKFRFLPEEEGEAVHLTAVWDGDAEDVTFNLDGTTRQGDGLWEKTWNGSCTLSRKQAGELHRFLGFVLQQRAGSNAASEVD